jgi:transposase, IS5 family
LRLLILKHVRNWSYAVLEREVRANLVYRDFTRVVAAKMPDAKTMGHWGLAVGPPTVEQIHERIVKITQNKGLIEGPRMRVHTTVVETNVHYPTVGNCRIDPAQSLRPRARAEWELGTFATDKYRSSLTTSRNHYAA